MIDNDENEINEAEELKNWAIEVNQAMDRLDKEERYVYSIHVPSGHMLNQNLIAKLVNMKRELADLLLQNSDIIREGIDLWLAANPEGK